MQINVSQKDTGTATGFEPYEFRISIEVFKTTWLRHFYNAENQHY